MMDMTVTTTHRITVKLADDEQPEIRVHTGRMLVGLVTLEVTGNRITGLVTIAGRWSNSPSRRLVSVQRHPKALPVELDPIINTMVERARALERA